jgi:hypothetical protein
MGRDEEIRNNVELFWDLIYEITNDREDVSNWLDSLRLPDVELDDDNCITVIFKLKEDGGTYRDEPGY